jgi:hypothetical protein
VPRYNVTETINASPTRSFEVFGDLRNTPKFISAIKSVEFLTEGPVGKGTRFKETRVMFGRDATETMEVTAWNPDGPTPFYTLSCDSCGAHMDTTFRFHPERNGSATRVEMDMLLKPVSLFAKIMTPLSKLMMGPMMKKCVLADFADARRVAEATPAN